MVVMSLTVRQQCAGHSTAQTHDRTAEGDACGRRDTVVEMTSARDLATRREVARAFAASSSARVIATFLMLAVALRAALGGLTWDDLAAVAGVVVFLGPVEWIIHRTLLHAQPTNRLAGLLGTRDSHERHHRVPEDLDWLLLRRPNAIGSCLAIVVPLGATALLFRSLDLVSPEVARTTAASAVIAGLLALAHYEWVHLLVHSKYRPTSRYYAYLDRNHRLHHFRNERYWLGVTVDVGDRLARTLPADRDAVPLSVTVRAPLTVASDSR
jgi:sterol desaturase/sphingolipid hydroxylase (fatty acid hydroxylase superfamily)